MRYSSTYLTLFLIFILFTPLILRHHYEEPYPAILLPAGSTIVSRNNDIYNFREFKILAIKNGEWKELTPRLFLDPIPSWYFKPILSSNFGLGNITLGRNHIVKLVCPEDVAKWASRQLTKLGYKDEKFKVIKKRVELDSTTGHIISSKTFYEKFFILH